MKCVVVNRRGKTNPRNHSHSFNHMRTMKRNSNLAKHSNFLLHIKKEQKMSKNFKIRLNCTEAIQQTLWV